MRIRSLKCILLVLPFLLLPATASATKYKTLYSFAGGSDGAYPVGGVVFDSSGNMYGVTNTGGNNECDTGLSAGCGTVFQLTADGNGSWKETVLHVFSQSTDGGNPGAPAVIDATGNLYGANLYYGPFANGSVWQLKSSGGTWTENILETFQKVRDGFSCYAVGFDPKGHLFGTTFGGGTHNDGIAFELLPSHGKWSEKILYAFAGGNNDGDAPADALTFGSGGAIYGTTYGGGPHLTGTVFELQKKKGVWSETPIYIFQGLGFGKSTDATNPVAGVIMDAAGNLYGTGDYGGEQGVGAVYELSPDGKGGWTEAVLYAFADGKDGGHPGGLIMDAAGNLYGLTSVTTPSAPCSSSHPEQAEPGSSRCFTISKTASMARRLPVRSSWMRAGIYTARPGLAARTDSASCLRLRRNSLVIALRDGEPNGAPESKLRAVPSRIAAKADS